MSLENYPGISDKRKEIIFAMSDAELLIEIEKGRESVMPKSIPFMRAVLAERNKQHLANQQATEKEYRDAILNETQISNSLSKDANDAGIKANRLSILAIIVSVVAIVIALVKG